jgi:MATE family multidrug resistance protein
MTETISHTTIWKLAGPMILANISTPLLGMVDTAVMGHLNSPHYLAAVALSSLIFSFLFWGFGFLRMATTGVTAQAKPEHINNILQQGLTLALLISVVILVSQSAVSFIAFSILKSSPEVITLAQTYFEIRVWSAPGILMNYVFLGWFIGQGKTRSALLMVLAINIANIILDLIFVNYLGMTIDGVAWASVIAEYIGLLVAVYIVFVQYPRTVFKHHILSSLSFSKSWLSLNGNIFIRTLCLIFSFAFFTYQGARQGEIILAANAVLLHFITFMAYVLDGFANATETITGKAVGLKNKMLLLKGLKLTAGWSVLVALLFSISYALFGQHIIRVLTDIPDIYSTATDYMFWLIIAPLLAVWSYLLDGLFIGATKSREMRNGMLLSTFICYLPAWYLLQPYGNDGLWLALLVFLTARGVTQAYYLPRILALK